MSQFRASWDSSPLGKNRKIFFSICIKIWPKFSPCLMLLREIIIFLLLGDIQKLRSFGERKVCYLLFVKFCDCIDYDRFIIKFLLVIFSLLEMTIFMIKFRSITFTNLLNSMNMTEIAVRQQNMIRVFCFHHLILIKFKYEENFLFSFLNFWWSIMFGWKFVFSFRFLSLSFQPLNGNKRVWNILYLYMWERLEMFSGIFIYITLGLDICKWIL